MIALVSAIRRRPGLSRAAFVEYLRDVHGAIATDDPLQLTAYRQNYVIDSVSGLASHDEYAVAPDSDAVVELVFEGLHELFGTMSAPYTREVVGPDGRNFSDLVSASALVTDVTEVPLRGAHRGVAKVIVLVGASGDASASGDLGGFASGAPDASALRSALVDGIAGLPDDLLQSIAAVTVQVRMPEGDELVGYFGGRDAPEYQAVLVVRTTDAADPLVAVGAVVAALPVVDPARTIIALVEEREIYRRA